MREEVKINLYIQICFLKFHDLLATYCAIPSQEKSELYMTPFISIVIHETNYQHALVDHFGEPLHS